MATRKSSRVVKRKVNKDFVQLTSYPPRKKHPRDTQLTRYTPKKSTDPQKIIYATKKKQLTEVPIADVDVEKTDGTAEVAGNELASKPKSRLDELSNPQTMVIESSRELENNTSDILINEPIDLVNLVNKTEQPELIRTQVEGTSLEVVSDAAENKAVQPATMETSEAELCNNMVYIEIDAIHTTINVSDRPKMQTIPNISTNELKCEQSSQKSLDEVVNETIIGMNENLREVIKNELGNACDGSPNTGKIQKNGAYCKGAQTLVAQNYFAQNGATYNDSKNISEENDGTKPDGSPSVHDSKQNFNNFGEAKESIKMAGLMSAATEKIQRNTGPKLIKSEEGLTRHRSTSTADIRAHVCEDCGQGFTKKSYLARHRLTHSGEKRYCCEICGKGFTRNNSLMIHLTSHTDEKNFACGLCDKSFKMRHSLRAHRNSHVPEKMLICHLCGKSFSSQEYLRQHVKLHSETSKFRCDLCNKTVRSKQSMLEHMLRHNGQKNIICKLCSKRFYNKKELSLHMKFHSNITDFQCKICQMYFKLEKSLEAHQSRMHGHRYTCHICDQHFSSQRSRQSHVFRDHPDQRATRKNKMLKHETANFKKVTCMFCGKVVSNKYRLRKHVQKKHGQKEYLIHDSFNKVATGNEKKGICTRSSQGTKQEAGIVSADQRSVFVEVLSEGLKDGSTYTSSLPMPTSTRTIKTNRMHEVGEEVHNTQTPIMVIFKDAPSNAAVIGPDKQVTTLPSNLSSNAVVSVQSQNQLHKLPTFLQESMDRSSNTARSDQNNTQCGSRSGLTGCEARSGIQTECNNDQSECNNDQSECNNDQSECNYDQSECNNDQSVISQVSRFYENEEVVIIVSTVTDGSANFDTQEHGYIHYTGNGEEPDQVAEEVIIQQLEDNTDTYEGIEYIEIDGTQYPFKRGARYDQMNFQPSAVTVRIDGSTSDAVFDTPDLDSVITRDKSEEDVKESIEKEEATSKPQDINPSATETCISSMKIKDCDISNNKTNITDSETEVIEVKHTDTFVEVSKHNYLNILSEDKSLPSSELICTGKRKFEENEVPSFKTENVKLLKTNALSKSFVSEGDSQEQCSKLSEIGTSTVDVIITKRETESPAKKRKTESAAMSSVFDTILPQTGSEEEFSRFEVEVCTEIKKLRQFDQYTKFLDNMLRFVQREQSDLMSDKQS